MKRHYNVEKILIENEYLFSNNFKYKNEYSNFLQKYPLWEEQNFKIDVVYPNSPLGMYNFTAKKLKNYTKENLILEHLRKDEELERLNQEIKNLKNKIYFQNGNKRKSVKWDK